MNVLAKVQEKVINSVMRQTIRKQLKSYRKRGISPTAEQVMQDINDNAQSTLTTHGYPPERIKVVVETELRRLE